MILIADDDPNIRKLLGEILEEEGYRVDFAVDGVEAKNKLTKNVYHVILADIKMPGISGIELLEFRNKICPGTAFIIITAYGTIKSAVSAVKNGAFNYITKPFEPEELISVVKSALEEFQSFSVDFEKLNNLFIGTSKITKEVIEQIKIASASDVTVLITGESGTGKSLVAEIIHKLSPRNKFPFVKINCSAIPDTLIEAELFGYEKGAFTGAIKRKPGKFELANKGTVFLDEVGDASPQFQAKLLSVIEEKTIETIGGTSKKELNIRFIAATNKNLKKLIEQGVFRQDLYYRLNVFSIHLPPLRERKEDIPLLASHFVNLFSKKFNKPIKNISSKVMELFFKYPWPGNIRELRNVIERAVVLSKGQTITLESLSHEFLEFTNNKDFKKRQILIEEKQKIILALEKARWNKTKAAQILGMTRSQLRYRLKKLGLE
ncbi:MAG: sigma-54-dependent Fis family transcriptional regulator [Thermodesulfobacteria bacterium]|nr:sigma-54-dependent Fis family transcriptional regulator [Thermodesulfobacteriota bacterium]